MRDKFKHIKIEKTVSVILAICTAVSVLGLFGALISSGLKKDSGGYDYIEPPPPPVVINYVSLGDSIAAGEMITNYWNHDTALAHQYGSFGKTSTDVISDTYTDIITRKLKEEYNADKVNCVSYARSGDTVKDLIEKLDDANVRQSIKNAHIVTICIGANDILGPALDQFDEYIERGNDTLVNLEGVINGNLQTLNNDSSPYSYQALFQKLNSINPQAQYVFTTVYNPYKYLFLEDDHGGFFAPLLDMIPEIEVDVDNIIENLFGFDSLGYPDITTGEWIPIELDADLSPFVKDALLNLPIAQQLFDRVNALSVWTEKIIEGNDSFKGLKQILREEINDYRKINLKFHVAETKALFDTYPDRTPHITDDIEYNHLVNVEYTRNYDVEKMDWGSLWENSDVATYWSELIFDHLEFINALPSTNVWDYLKFDSDGFGEVLLSQVVEKVIRKDIDPHPELQGHAVIAESLENVLFR